MKARFPLVITSSGTPHPHQPEPEAHPKTRARPSLQRCDRLTLHTFYGGVVRDVAQLGSALDWGPKKSQVQILSSRPQRPHPHRH